MSGTSYEAAFGPILAAIETEMQVARQEQQPVAPLLWDVIDYQFGWDLDADDAGRGRVAGKKIRPLLMALVAQAVCGAYRHVLPAGAALEFIHNFTLIHDDVMDKSEERRHRPTVWTRWGPWQAINTGDGLYALAMLCSVRLAQADTPPARIVRVVEALARACLHTAEGQILDMDFEGRADVGADEYVTMVANKTGALIRCAALVGALLSSDDEDLIAHYAAFGQDLGIAFQIRDDYLGVWGDETRTGKSATSDIREKKKSYPVLVAFERATETDRATLDALYGAESFSDADVDTVLDILARTDAQAATDQIARAYYDAALAHLEHTGAAPEALMPIHEYAAFLLRRAY